MKIVFTLFISSMVFISYVAIAANSSSLSYVSQFLHPKDWAFEENKGQLADPSGNPLPEIKYFGSFGGAEIYCSNQKLSFVFTKTNQISGTKNPTKKKGIEVAITTGSIINASRLDLEFEGANTDAKIIPADKQDMTVNYAKPNIDGNSINSIGFYKTLTYINVYDHIDMVVSANSTGLEYEFIVHPGGNPKDIKLVRNGADNMEMLTNGGIKYSTALGTLEESKPQSFVGSKTIASNFIRNGNILSFKTEEYDRSKDLVIDPGVQWSTYLGSDSSDGAVSTAIDQSGNVFIAGFTKSIKGIATKGAYQTSYSGGSSYDVLAAKFSGNGKLIWATYYGGNAQDEAQGCAVDNSGNLYVTGYTQSPTGLATKGAYHTALSGNFDAFLAKFNTNGGLIWGTYFGASDEDVGWSVAVDRNNNAYVSGYTISTSGIATKGSFQTSYGGGNYDAFIAKFSSAGSLNWATYFGGAYQDQGTGIGLDNLKNIYITGYTASPNGIATTGAYKTNCDIYNGDAFLACLDSNGFQKWGTYFGGTGGANIGYALATNGKDKVYFTGLTETSSNVATTGSSQSIYGGGHDDVFVADFNTLGSINWATYYGGNASDEAYGISTDSSGNIFITGITVSTNQIATAGAFQTAMSNTNGNAFLAEFYDNGILRYGTYYAGSALDVGWGITNDNSGNIYIAGVTYSSGLATSGAYQTSQGGSNDAFIAKFPLCYLTSSVTGSVNACTNSTTTYLASKHTNSDYTWTVSGGTITSGNNTDSIIVKWNGSGTGSVAEQETNSLTGCSDKRSLKVAIAAMLTPKITGDTIVCPLNTSSYRITPTAGASYSWTVKTGSITIPNGKDSTDVFWLSAGKGYVAVYESIGGGVCKGYDTIHVIVAKPVAAVKISNQGNGLYSFTSVDSTEPGSAYAWVINGVKINGSYSEQYNFTHKGSYTVSLTVTNKAGCSNTFDTTINVSDAEISLVHPENINWTIFPNPFKDQVEINYTVTESGLIEITVTDLLGRNVATVENKNLQPGSYKSILDANKANILEGIYLITMKVNGAIETQRIVRVKY